MTEFNAGQPAGEPLTVGAAGVETDREAFLAALAREAGRLLEDVQDARLLPPPPPEEALRLKAEWERLTRWSAGRIVDGGVNAEQSIAALMQRCRDELAALLEEANQEAARRDDAPV